LLFVEDQDAYAAIGLKYSISGEDIKAQHFREEEGQDCSSNYEGIQRADQKAGDKVTSI
jgi:hypothetical protein